MVVSLVVVAALAPSSPAGAADPDPGAAPMTFDGQGVPGVAVPEPAGWSGDDPAVAAAAVDGGSTVFASGSAAVLGSTGRTRLNAPLIDLVPTRSGSGYWLLAQDGGIFSYGDAPFYGSTGDLVLNEPVVAMTASTTGSGYLFVARDGGVFAFGDARFHGSIPGVLPAGAHLNQPIVGVVPTPTGGGYWMVAADGGVFAFGDATFVGSLGATPSSSPIEAFVPSATGHGYWMVARDGTVHEFGDAPPAHLYPLELAAGGSFTLTYRDQVVTDAAALPDGSGLVAVTISGAVLVGPYDALDAVGPLPVVPGGPNQEATSIAVPPGGGGLWIGTTGWFVPTGTPGGPHSFIRTDGSGQPVRWSACAPITWLFNPQYAPAEGLELVQTVIDYLAQLTGFDIRYGGTTDRRPIDNSVTGTVVIGWNPGAPSGGWARPISSGGSRIRAGSVELSASQVGGLFGLPVRHGPGSFGSVLLHEMGHVFGLGHVDTGTEIMGSGLLGRFGPGDLEGLARLDASHGC